MLRQFAIIMGIKIEQALPLLINMRFLFLCSKAGTTYHALARAQAIQSIQVFFLRFLRKCGSTCIFTLWLLRKPNGFAS